MGVGKRNVLRSRTEASDLARVQVTLPIRFHHFSLVLNIAMSVNVPREVSSLTIHLHRS